MTTGSDPITTPIEWGPAFTHDQLPGWIDHRLTSGHPERVRVASVRPVGESDWMAFETGWRGLTKVDIAEEGKIEVRLGWGAPGCIERLPEFEGW